MKKIYCNVSLTIVFFDQNDVITASGDVIIPDVWNYEEDNSL